ncbi:MAG: fimbrillin family protein [Bacteroidales bacterium]|nr:fimbrillin family protein [Candidatus Cacconaster scatequi]
MTTIRRIILYGCLLVAAACTKDIVTPEPPAIRSEGILTFSAEMLSDPGCLEVTVDSIGTKGFGGAYFIRTNGESIDKPITKAAPVENLTTYGDFSLFGYMYDTWSGSSKPNYMFDEKVQYSSPTWQTTHAFNTNLSDKNLRFYAYAPYGASGVSVASSLSGPLAFTYTVPSAVSSQNDLLVGSSPEYNGKLSNLSVSFGHCLSAVTFKTGTETVNGTIKSITLKGVYSKGKYTCGSGWGSLSSAGNFSVSSNISVTEGTSKTLTSGASTMMLIPQTVPSGATIEVVIESEGKTHTLSASIAGDKWQEGKKCVYSLSFDSIAGMKISLNVSSLTLEWGEYKDITVTGDPIDQNWTKVISGTGLSAEKINNTTLRVTNNNISGTDSQGTLTVTTEDAKRFAQVSITAKSLQESISLSPTSKTIDYGSTVTFTASGTYPQGYTLNSPTGVTITKDGNSISVKNTTASYTAKDITLSAETNIMKKKASASIHLVAKPETIKLDKSSMTIGSAGSGTVTASGNYDSFSATLSSTTYASVSVSGNKITVTNKNTTYESKTVTLTVKTSGDTGATATVTITLEPLEDYVIDYTISDISLSTTSIGAGGGTITVSGGSVTQNWVSGKKVENYATATLKVERTTLNSSYPASVSGKTITVKSLGTSVVSSGTYTVTASYSNGGISASNKSAQFSQGENKITDSNYNPSGYSAYASIGSGISAAGGSATVTYYAYHNAYNKYSSGSSDGTVHTVYDKAQVSLSANGNSAFSLSGTLNGSSSSNTCTISHSNMTTNERTDKVTVKVVNSSSTSSYKEASASVTNNRYTGTKSTKNHTRTGSVSYGSKSYGSTTYGTKSYGSEYLKSTDYGTKVTDSDTYGSWSTYQTSTDKYDYAVSLSVTSWTPGSASTNQSNTVTAYHYERSKNDQRRTITHNYHQSYTQHYYRDYTRSASRSYTRTASQNCNYTEYRTDSFDSGSTLYVEESKSHTETWTDSGTETLSDDTGSEWYRDNSGTSYSTSDGGYDYRTTYGTGSKVSDSVTPTSNQSWLTYSSGKMYVTENTATSQRSATLSVSNGTASASCSVTQGKAEYDIVIN